MNDTIYINLVSIVAGKIKKALVLYEFSSKLWDILTSGKADTFFVYVSTDGVTIDYVLYNNIDKNTDVYMVWIDCHRRWLPSVGIITERIPSLDYCYTFGKLHFDIESALSVGDVIFQTQRDDSGIITRKVIAKEDLCHFKISWDTDFGITWFLTEDDAIQECRSLHNYWSDMYY